MSLAAPAPRQRYAYLEVARVVCIVAVVLAHSTDTVAGQSGLSTLTLTVSAAIRFVVPAFFMISGLLLGLRHRDAAYRLDARGFWRSRALTIIVPFFVWNLIYMTILVVASGGSVLAAGTLFDVTTGYMHLYFVAALIQFLAIYTIVARFFSARLLAVCVVLAAVSSVAFYAVSDYLLWTRGADGHAFEWHWGKLALAWALYFFWGLWLGYREGVLEWLRTYRWWLVLATIVAFVPYWLETRYQFTHLGSVSRDFFVLSGLPYQFIGANALLAVLYAREPVILKARVGRVVVGWGALMFGVYVAHVALLHYLGPLWQRLWPTAPAAVGIVVMTLLAFFVTLAFVWLCGTRYLWPAGVVLFGGRGRPRGRRGTPPTPPPGASS